MGRRASLLLKISYIMATTASVPVPATRRRRCVSRRASWALLIALGVLAAHPRDAAGQTPASATLTQWDIFTATGGNASATQNPLPIALTPAGSPAGTNGSLWFVAQRPSMRLGRLDPATNIYTEWRPAEGVANAAPNGLAVNGPTGDVWITTGGIPEAMVKLGGGDTFRKIQFPASVSTHNLAVTPDGNTAYAIVKVASLYYVYTIPKPTAAGSLAIARLRFNGSTEEPRHLSIDGAGKFWLTNKTRNILVRWDPSLTSPLNLTKWVLPSGISPAGLHIKNGPNPGDGAVSVCVVSEGTPGASPPSGDLACLTPADNMYRL